MTAAKLSYMAKSKFTTVVECLFLLAMCCHTAQAKPKEIVYELTCSAQPVQTYHGLPKGLIVSTICDVNNSQLYDTSLLSEKQAKAIAKRFNFVFKPNVSDFFDESFKKYARSAGFNLGYDRRADYSLRVRLRELKLSDNVGSAKATSIIEWSLISPENQIVLDGTARGIHSFSAGQAIPDVLDKAYSKAIADIDWGGIAWTLGNSDSAENKRADQEKNKQVKGDGDTALEHTVIRWFIMSSPAGADVSWRVVSSTPDVRNTNSNFVGTTPYETTESFDIRGLKYDNAGNVQIEVTCEKNGYVTQRKRFNLRQAIDQREISAKFNLVKETEE